MAEETSDPAGDGGGAAHKLLGGDNPKKRAEREKLLIGVTLLLVVFAYLQLRKGSATTPAAAAVTTAIPPPTDMTGSTGGDTSGTSGPAFVSPNDPTILAIEQALTQLQTEITAIPSSGLTAPPAPTPAAPPAGGGANPSGIGYFTPEGQAVNYGAGQSNLYYTSPSTPTPTLIAYAAGNDSNTAAQVAQGQGGYTSFDAFLANQGLTSASQEQGYAAYMASPTTRSAPTTMINGRSVNIFTGQPV